MKRTLSVLVLSALPALVYAGPITANLLSNPGAESGNLTGWTIGVGTPTTDGGTFDPAITPHTGSFDFVGVTGPLATLLQTQSILVSGITGGTVDAGNLMANVTFWEQGLNQGSPSDDAFISLTFLDGTSATIGTASTITVDSHGGTWTSDSESFAIPVGTRSITYQMNFVRNSGTDNDGFVDDNSLVISTSAVTAGTPEPSAFGLVLGALAAGGLFLRRKR